VGRENFTFYFHQVSLIIILNKAFTNQVLTNTPAVKKISVPNYSNDQVMGEKPLDIYLEWKNSHSPSSVRRASHGGVNIVTYVEVNLTVKIELIL
jgi:hypothetical protein